MVEFGILDPTKVTRTALQNAASIAGLMITTEAMVAEAAEEGRAGRCRPAATAAAWAAWISDPRPTVECDHDARPSAGLRAFMGRVNPRKTSVRLARMFEPGTRRVSM
jgi:hypothetical protein